MVRVKSEKVWRICLIFALILASALEISHGCQMEGVIMWPIPVSESILDTHTGTVLDRSTTNIEAITTIRYGEGLNAGPYLEVSHSENRFQMWVNDAYSNYEENEVAQSMSMTVTFRCTGGTTNNLVFWINVIDTNNNAPQFRPDDEFEFIIATPVPPGFLVTGCFDNIVVRDIDLTTQRIDFSIEENPYFEIEYDSALSSTPKEFKAILRTKTFIRTLPEAVALTITATDVDLTDDQPLTTSATVHVKSDTEFEFPEELVFAQTFYIANYNDGQITHDVISLRQGFDEQVEFSLSGEHLDNFQLDQNLNQITISVRTPLSNLEVNQVLLVVNAQREYTSGASATVIVQLPEEVNLEFERAHYSGQIENNILQLSQLVLIQRFEGTISTRILSEHASFFSATVQENIVTLTMTPLTDNIIRDNNFVYLEVEVSTERDSGSTIVTLEIIKDDDITPVFNQGIYTGTYDTTEGLRIESIYLVQGYGDAVDVNLYGEYSELFEVEKNGAIISITTSSIPTEIHALSHLLLSLEASKPRTVGANATIVIDLPEARELGFEQPTYRGTLQDNILTLETIVLSVGYQNDVSFNLIGEHKDYFVVSNVQSSVTLSLLELPESVISENNLILLTLEATARNAVTTTANVLLEIIKEDVTTPLFTRNIYYGSYIGTQNLDIENINLAQGFDGTVIFRIDGEYSEFFEISNTGNNVLLSLRSPIPADVIFSEKVLSFSILADKAFTVGANAAILIRFPPEMTESTVLRFSQNTYVGSLEGERLSIENIVLETGFATGTQFELTGEHRTYFSISNNDNTITISPTSPLPSQVTDGNDFIILELEATRERAVSVTATIIIHFVRQDVIHPTFAEAYYRGVYTETTGLEIEAISLFSGYDETVIFQLEGESSSLFSITQNNNLAIITLQTPLPQSVLEGNNHLLFSVVANKPNAIPGRAAVLIDLPTEFPEVLVLGFTQNNYVASLQNGILESPEIALRNSQQQANINIIGEYSDYFRVTQESNVIRLVLANDLPSDTINSNNFIVLSLEATYPNAISGYTTIIIDIIKDSVRETPIFSEAYYFGEYSEQTGLVFEHTIQLVQGFDETVTFALTGDDSQWFRLVQVGPNNYGLSVLDNVIQIRDRCKLLFNIIATKPGTLDGQVAVVISLKDFTTSTTLRFNQDVYRGVTDGNTLALNAMSLEGYETGVTYSLIGDNADYFQLNNQNGLFTLLLRSNLPDTIISDNNVLVLTVEAQINHLRTHSTILLEINTPTDELRILTFEQTYYVGSYSVGQGLSFEHNIRVIEDYDDVSFELNGDDAQWFRLTQSGRSVSLVLTAPIPSSIIANNQKLIFTVVAQRSGSIATRATIIIALPNENIEVTNILSFERVTYLGSVDGNTITIDPIILTEGFSSNVVFSLFGELADLFSLTPSGETMLLTLIQTIPEESIPLNRIIVLELQASAPGAVSAQTAVVLTVATDDDSAPVIELVFESPYYTGSYSEVGGLVFESPISLSQGYDASVQFYLEGENAQWFNLVQSQNSVSLILQAPLPSEVIANNRKLIFFVTAQRNGSGTARTTIVISILEDGEITPDVYFDNVLYKGLVQGNIVRHESISVVGFAGTNIQLIGEFASLFEANLNNGAVNVQLSGLTSIPSDVTIIPLQLHASNARAVLLLTVESTENPIPPLVSFGSSSYSLRIDITRTGLIGYVHATANNGEPVTYSIRTDNAHLLERLSVNDDGELHLSAPFNSGVYLFEVVAATIFTQATASAAVHLTVDVVTVCGDDIVVPPLIVLDRDEESPHRDLVVLNPEHEGCRYTMTNRWPIDQNWLYVDETGLHTTSIDREHESIAFMKQSQVQIELILHCENENSRAKRSVNQITSEYGTSTWILTDSILYNSRRSLVNLIVNDINDNAPVFLAKENEPIAVGYPIPDIEVVVLPRALVELKASDADIGENAALRYWSEEPVLAVSPSSGFVHVSSGSLLQQDSRLTVHATDRNGEGLTGSITLLVKLLDLNNIVVVTIQNSFLDDEQSILSQLSNGVGYEVNVLRSIITSQGIETVDDNGSREKRDATATGASMQLYVYGLIEREPVTVERLTNDINNIEIVAGMVANVVSLEDHLEGREICVIAGRDTGLLIATILLSILLFIIIVVAIVWFIYTRRKSPNYEQFSDKNSIASRTDSLGQAKPEAEQKPRLNIDDLRKSEKRLQEILDAPPLEEVKTTTPKDETPVEAIIEIPPIIIEPSSTIVIQSIDKLKDATDESDDDEFGEDKKNRRKSVVTFNENVEKIIHVEDDDDTGSVPGYEIYKL